MSPANIVGMLRSFPALRVGVCIARLTARGFLAAGLLLSTHALAQQSQQDQFTAALFQTCTDPSLFTNPRDPATQQLIRTCTKAFGGGLSSVGAPANSLGGNLTNSATLGSVSMGGGVQEARCTGSIAKCREEKKKNGGASADFSLGNLGFLASLQTGKVDRDTTVLESGYAADVRGGTVGVDYKFSDQVVVGLIYNRTANRATLTASTDAANSTNKTYTLYGVYTPVANAYVSAYTSTGRVDQDSSRRVSYFGTPGTIFSQNDGNLDSAGIAGGYDWAVGTATLGAFLNVDGQKMRFDGYTETGTVGVEGLLQTYPTQKIDSLTSTLGLRLSARKPFEWGALTPEARLAVVHQFRNDARTIVSALAVNPASAITETTDAPDRDYQLAGLGLVAELGRAVRLFADYERRFGHSYLNSWTATLGIHVGF